MPVNSFENYPMSWKPDISSMKPPLYKSLASAMEDDILNGILKPGDKLPPQRELADFLDINLSTITRAFKICELKGLISGHIGRGTYVSSDAHISSQLICSEPQKNCINIMTVPDKFKNSIKEGICNINIVSSPFNAEIVCSMIESGLASKILNERKEMTLERNKVVDKILHNHTVLGNKYSPFRWLILPPYIDSQNFENDARKNGVEVYCASRFSVGNCNFDSAVRLSICSPETMEDLKKGLNILNDLIK